MKATKKVAIGVVGPGLVGGELLRQMEATRPLLEKEGIDVRPTPFALSALHRHSASKDHFCCSLEHSRTGPR